jgi:hypothetical protein
VNGTRLTLDWSSILVILLTVVVMVVLFYQHVARYHQQDRLMLRRLRRARFDLKQPHHAAFVVFVKTEAAVAALSERFRADGFEPQSTPGRLQFTKGKHQPGPADDGWMVRATKLMVIDPDEVDRLRAYFHDIAEKADGVYLGWEARKG